MKRKWVNYIMSVIVFIEISMTKNFISEPLITFYISLPTNTKTHISSYKCTNFLTYTMGPVVNSQEYIFPLPIITRIYTYMYLVFVCSRVCVCINSIFILLHFSILNPVTDDKITGEKPLSSFRLPFLT